MSGTVGLDQRGQFEIRTPYQALPFLQRLPDRRLWDAKTKCWRASASRVNVEHLRRYLPLLTWSPEAAQHADEIINAAKGPALALINDYEFAEPILDVGDGEMKPRPPFAHQKEAFAKSRYAPAYALLMEQRTGKTRVLIDTASDWFLRSKLDAIIVVCPKSVRSVWVDDIPLWTPPKVPIRVIEYRSELRNKLTASVTAAFGGLAWLVMNVEAFSTNSAQLWLRQVMAGKRLGIFIDESTRIKHPSSNRTKAILKLNELACLRRIATGTPITQGPLDLFTQFSFLDPAILGYKSYYAFRNEYAILGGFENKVILDYINIDSLAEKIAPFSYRKLRADCFDMPPKIYLAPRIVELSEEHRRIYNQMRDELRVQINGMDVINTTIVLTQLLRLQQITGGFIPQPPQYDETGRKIDIDPIPVPGPNPKLEALFEILEDEPGKVVIWSRFKAELRMIATALRERFGPESTVEFHGGIDDDARYKARTSFQDPKSPVKCFVGNQATGGLGIPLWRGALTTYFSNSYSLEERLQSEDRMQGASQRWSASYLDIVAKDTRDEEIRQRLRSKKGFADMVTKDKVLEWLK